MAKVIATARGYYGGSIREAGETFDADGKASWFDPVRGSAGDEPDPAPAQKAAAKAPAKGKAGSKNTGPTEPFGDAPAPVTVKNEINDALGTTQPDWANPSGADI